jgi:hypothetical protein
MNICKLFSKIIESRTSPLFNGIIGYNDVKRLCRMALDSDEQTHILLSGPPASAKTMFLESLSKLKGSYFVDGALLAVPDKPSLKFLHDVLGLLSLLIKSPPNCLHLLRIKRQS